MPIALEFYDNGVVVRHTVVIADDELIQAEREIYSYVYPQRLRFQIIDLTEVEVFQASGETMRFLGQTDYALTKSLDRQHIVVVAPAHGRSQSIIWEAWAQDADTNDPAILTEIVNTIDEAIRWLGDNGVKIPSGEPNAGSR